MSTNVSKIQVGQVPRPTPRAAEVRALGVQAAALSLQALKLSRMAAELAKGAR